jgi:hypothetical protein
MRKLKFSKSIKKWLKPAKSMICRFFLSIAIAKIFKNTHNFCGKFMAIFRKSKIATKLPQIKS